MRLFSRGLSRNLGLASAILTGQPEALQIAILKGRTAFCRRAMVIVVIHLVISDCRKGRTRLANIALLQQAFVVHVAREASRKAIRGQLPLFPLRMSAQLAEIGVAEFVSNDGKGTEISIFGRHLIT